MGRIERSWTLFKACFSMLRRQKRLVVFPLLSLTAAAIQTAVMGGIGFLIIRATHGELIVGYVDFPHFCSSLLDLERSHRLAFFVFFFLDYAVINFTIIFFSAAMIACVLARLEGRDQSLAYGLKMAWGKVGRIVAWSLFAGLVGQIIDRLAQLVPYAGGYILGWIGAISWSLATYFVVPVLIFEQGNVVSSIKRSSDLFRKTWGEQLSGGFGLDTIYGIVGIIGILLIFFVGNIFIPYHGHYEWLTIFIWGGITLYLTVLWIIFDCLGKLFNAILYSYAVTGMLPAEISPDLLPRPKPKIA